jgi:hypothetical protein
LDQNRRIGPSKGAVILLSLLLGGLFAYGIYEAVRGAWLQASFLGVLAVGMWISVLTTRVLIPAGRIGLSRYGRTMWEVPIADCGYEMVWRGMKGTGAPPHRMVVYDKATRRRIGDVYPRMLAEEDWGRILAHTGATL